MPLEVMNFLCHLLSPENAFEVPFDYEFRGRRYGVKKRPYAEDYEAYEKNGPRR